MSRSPTQIRRPTPTGTAGRAALAGAKARRRAARGASVLIAPGPGNGRLARRGRGTMAARRAGVGGAGRVSPRRRAARVDMVQAGAVPYRVDARGVMRICLITNSQGGWIVPKGKIDPGHTGREAASIECYEEAGLRGVLHRVVVGAYDYQKPGDPPRWCRVRLYALRVTEELSRWPEVGHRRRQWLTLSEAARRVAFRDLAAVILRLRRTMRRAGR